MGAVTRIDLRIQKAKGSPHCIGVGFVALDIIEGESGTFAAVGGSCGNVMAILAWLGWSACASSRLSTDLASNMVVQELSDIGVDVSGLMRDDTVSTPIVIQKFITHADGRRGGHRYSLSCPDCGGWLPRFRAATLRQIEPLLERIKGVKTYYFDRVTPASLKAAAAAADVGALVVFEPPSIGDERAFQRAVDLCDVLKYSNDRLGHLPDLAAANHPSLIVETMGADGLRVRWRKNWTCLPAFEASVFKDAAGSGDWCTAGLIHAIGAKGRQGLAVLRKDDIERGLRFGQALATLNCGFEGARGLMSAKQPEVINRALRALQEKASLPSNWTDFGDEVKFSPEIICALCTPDGEKKSARRTG